MTAGNQVLGLGERAGPLVALPEKFCGRHGLAQKDAIPSSEKG